MTEILTEGADITVSLLSGSDPRRVMVEVRGLTIGLPVTITASAGSWSRVVQGADGVVLTSTQLVLVDVATPLNTPVTWTAVQGARTMVSEPLTVPVSGDAVVQSLDGATVALIDYLDNADPRDGKPRQALYTPAGRSRPVVHYDVEAYETGAVQAETAGVHTRALLELVRAGAPVVLRTDLGLRDLDPVQLVVITAYPRRLVGAVGTRRAWDLAFTVVDDDDAAPLSVATLDAVDAAWTGLMLDDVDAMLAGLVLADLNVIDWAAP